MYTNTKVKISISIPIDRPTKNGTIFTKEAVEEALSQLGGLPIVDNDRRVIGYTTNTPLPRWDFINHAYEVEVEGNIFDSTPLITINEFEDNKITDFRIVSFGLGDKL